MSGEVIFGLREGNDFPTLCCIGLYPKVQFVQVCNIDNNEHKKQVNHSIVCPKLYAMQYVHLDPDHNNRRIKYSLLE